MSSTNNRNVVKSSVNINPNLFGKMMVKIHSCGYQYSGRFKLNDSAIYIKLNRIKHNEQMLWIFNEPLMDDCEILFGLFSAIIESRKPFVGRIFFHKIAEESNSEIIDLKNCSIELGYFINQLSNITRIDYPSNHILNEKIA